MKTLGEIELDYVRNIIEFFCKEYPTRGEFFEYKYKL